MNLSLQYISMQLLDLASVVRQASDMEHLSMELSEQHANGQATYQTFQKRHPGIVQQKRMVVYLRHLHLHGAYQLLLRLHLDKML